MMCDYCTSGCRARLLSDKFVIPCLFYRNTNNITGLTNSIRNILKTDQFIVSYHFFHVITATLPSQYPSDATTPVLLRSNTTSELFLFQQLPCIATTSDVETFVDPVTSQQCVAIGNQVTHTDGVYDTVLYVYIYCLENVTSGFYFKQAIPTFGVKKVQQYMQSIRVGFYIYCIDNVTSLKNLLSTRMHQTIFAGKGFETHTQRCITALLWTDELDAIHTDAHIVCTHLKNCSRKMSYWQLA